MLGGNRMKKIIFLDLDGTLWNFEQIPDSALKAIDLAHQNGHKIFTNTGRSKCEVPQLLWDLNLDGYCFSAGSEIIIGHQQVLFKPLEKRDTLFIQHIAKNIGYSLEGSSLTFSTEKNRERMRQFHVDNRMGNRFLSFPDISTMHEKDYEQIMKVSIHFDEESQKDALLKQLPEHLTFTNFMHLGGEITQKNYNKASAIRFVQNFYQEEYSTVAIGDSENDLSMLEHADFSVAMANGCESVKEKADYVTDKIDNDGLYKAFKFLKLF